MILYAYVRQQRTIDHRGVCLWRPSVRFGWCPNVQHVGVRGRTLLWAKENLLNLGIARLPPEWKYVAWIDADVMFRRPNWAMETVHALQLYDIVQPWPECYDLGPNGEHPTLHRSFCRQYVEDASLGDGPYAFAHPGYAWAATRRTLEHLGGLIETAPLEAADHHMALGLIGSVDRSVHGGRSAPYFTPLHQWQARALRHVAGNIRVVPRTIELFLHGAKTSRRYVERWNVLVRHSFDPTTDLKRNIWGVWELAGNKPALQHDINRYFYEHHEEFLRTPRRCQRDGDIEHGYPAIPSANAARLGGALCPDDRDVLLGHRRHFSAASGRVSLADTAWYDFVSCTQSWPCAQGRACLIPFYAQENNMRNCIIVVMGLSLLTACSATPVPRSPAQAVFALEATYDVALNVAIAYAMLPQCRSNGVGMCSDPAVVRQVNEAAHRAWVAIGTASRIARTIQPDASALRNAEAAAEQALAELRALTSNLKVS